MDNHMIVMALTRMTFGFINLIGALLMWKLRTVDNALRINGIIGSIGPFVMLFVSVVGMIGLANKIPPGKLVLIGLGVIFILWGTR